MISGQTKTLNRFVCSGNIRHFRAWPKIHKALKKDARLKRGVGAVIGGVKQSTVERIEGETEEEKVEISGASCDTVTRTLRR
jgi:hypothetical protein